MYSEIVDLWDIKGTIYTDQTGKFPTKARSGARYIMIMVAIDSNTVLAATLKKQVRQGTTPSLPSTAQEVEAGWS